MKKSLNKEKKRKVFATKKKKKKVFYSQPYFKNLLYNIPFVQWISENKVLLIVIFNLINEKFYWRLFLKQTN